MGGQWLDKTLASPLESSSSHCELMALPTENLPPGKVAAVERLTGMGSQNSSLPALSGNRRHKRKDEPPWECPSHCLDNE